MLTKRIIPCLDVKDLRVVKGVNFLNLKDVDDPVELAKYYSDEGADELVFLDISATNEKRKIFIDLVRKIAQNINIPFTIGGGIKSASDVEALLNAGADRISLNTHAIFKPGLINELVSMFGSQCIVIAIDAKLTDNGWRVYVNSGQVDAGLDAIKWSKEVVDRGAGEILLTSMNNDGTKSGFAIEIIDKVSREVSIPVIASGGAGSIEHFLEVFKKTNADAVLAASLFHYKTIRIPELKNYLWENGISVRRKVN